MTIYTVFKLNGDMLCKVGADRVIVDEYGYYFYVYVPAKSGSGEALSYKDKKLIAGFGREQVAGFRVSEEPYSYQD